MTQRTVPVADIPRHMEHTLSPDLHLALERFLLERRGLDLAPTTMAHYTIQLGQFFSWVAVRRPEVTTITQLDKELVVAYRVFLAERPPIKSSHAARLGPDSLQASQRALRTFFGWAREDGYPVDERILRLRKTRIPRREAMVYTLPRLRQILAACTCETERVAVRLLVGSGERKAEAVGLSFRAPDGLSDLSTDALADGWAELRIRWDAGAKGRRARRVPVPPSLALALKRYQARHRQPSTSDRMLISRTGRPFAASGLDTMAGRLGERVGFRVHCHAFRHTFATVQAKAGRSLEHLRAAMGHEDYSVLIRYVQLASSIDLGPLSAWEEFVALPHPRQYQ
jgi:integrase